MAVITDKGEIDKVLTRGVDSIYPSKEALAELLASGKRIRLYQGFDPTGTEIHIGHMVGLRKLAQFQKLGHEVIFLVGDGTGQAGDPSGKTKARDKFFTTDELRDNARDYLKQASRIVNFEGDNPITLKFNGDWLNKLNLTDILGIAEHFTLQQLSERDMFQERMKKGEPVNLREFLYPLLQGYDSVAMDVDLELGATDQTFNMLTGRTLQKVMNEREKLVLTTPLLVDKTGRKLGKSEGNAISVVLPPSELYGGIMTLPDEVIVDAMLWLTDVSEDEIAEMKKDIDGGGNPMAHKKRLAFEIVKDLNDEEAANHAAADFEQTFSKGGTPLEVTEITVASGTEVMQIAIDEEMVGSKSEFRRLVSEGAVTVNGNKLEDFDGAVTEETMLKIGKRRFLNIKIS